jgi:hypothetical protein
MRSPVRMRYIQKGSRMAASVIPTMSTAGPETLCCERPREARALLPRRGETISSTSKRPTRILVSSVFVPAAWPNQPPEPTCTAVTSRADARLAPAVPVAHL